MTTDIEGTFMSPVFVADEEYFHRLNAGFKPYEGWSNSATWCFYLYFTQEEENIQALRSKIRKDGKLNTNVAFRVMRQPGIQIDMDCEGPVNVPEFIQQFLKDYGGSEGE